MSSSVADPTADVVSTGTSVRPVMLLTIAVPFDERATLFALDSALHSGAKLIVCEGIFLSAARPGNTANFVHALESRACEVVAERARALEIKTELAVFHSPRPITGALAAAKNYEIGLLVFGPERTRLARWNYWMWSRRIRRDAPCLVWVPD